MDGSRLVRTWNAAIKLRRPRLSELRARLQPPSWEPAFSTTPELLFLGDNLFARLHPGATLDDDRLVVSVHLATAPGPLAEGGRVTLEELPSLYLLGVSVGASAAEFLGRLARAAAPGTAAPLLVPEEREEGRFTLDYGGALSLAFHALDADEDPARSRLVSVEFLYAARYRGAIPARLAFQRAPAWRRLAERLGLARRP
jgi:hypothetical protein